MSSDRQTAGTQHQPNPLLGLLASLALASVSIMTLWTAVFGTPQEFGVALLALAIVVGALWRCVR